MTQALMLEGWSGSFLFIILPYGEYNKISLYDGFIQNQIRHIGDDMDRCVR
jgi:hypothetical protein